MCVWVLACVLVTQSVRLCDPMDCSPPGSSVLGILQARILEWVAIPFSNCLWGSQGKNIEVVCHSLLQWTTFRQNSPLIVYLTYMQSQFSSVQFSHSIISDSLWPHGLQHARLLYPLPTPGTYSNSCPLHRWCHPTISSSVVSFSSHLQSFPASGSFPVIRRVHDVKCWTR